MPLYLNVKLITLMNTVPFVSPFDITVNSFNSFSILGCLMTSLVLKRPCHVNNFQALCGIVKCLC